jgi:hypothetical protein
LPILPTTCSSSSLSVAACAVATILIHPGVTSSFAVAYIVLGISTVFDLMSFRQSAGQMIGAQPRLPARCLAADSGKQRHADNFTQPLRPADEEKVRGFLLACPGVTAIRELLVTFVGPGRVWIVARIDVDDGLSGAKVKSLVRNIESGLKHESDSIYRVDVVPVEDHGP